MAYLINHRENFEKGTGHDFEKGAEHDVYWFNGYGQKVIRKFKTEEKAMNFIRSKLKLPPKIV